MLTWPLFYYDIPTKNAFKEALYHGRRRYVDISEFKISIYEAAIR